MKSLLIFGLAAAVFAVCIIFYVRCRKNCCKSECSSVCSTTVKPTKLQFYNLRFPYSLPALKYDYTALEPHVDAETMNIHHTKHHQAYIDTLNKTLQESPEYQKYTIEELLTNLEALPKSIRERVRNHGGGHFNHTLFWDLMSPQSSGQPTELIAHEIKKHFGTFESFREQFEKAAISRFGSGWGWLCLNKDKQLVVISTPNQDTPLAQGLYPILALDVWEHAYYLKYRNKRADYIGAWWNVVNWKHVEKLYHDGVKALS